jgi:hypothetical protein
MTWATFWATFTQPHLATLCVADNQQTESRGEFSVAEKKKERNVV